MNVLGVGIAVVAVALIALVIGLVQRGKAGKIRSVPFKKPSEIAQQGMNAGDAKQMVSTEGRVGGTPIAAPMSGQPCLYYEIEVTRGYHTMSKNQQGHPTKNHGTKSVMSRKEGTVFTLGDGAGAAFVDCSKAPSMDLKQSHRNRINTGLVSTPIVFGSVRVDAEGLASNVAGLLIGGETTDYYEGVERIVPYTPDQTLYALGKLAPTSAGVAIGPSGWSALMLSDKGRDGALGSAAKTAQIALIAGAVLLVGGGVCTTIGLLGESSASAHERSASAAPASKPPPPAPAKKK